MIDVLFGSSSKSIARNVFRNHFSFAIGNESAICYIYIKTNQMTYFELSRADKMSLFVILCFLALYL